VFTRGPLDVGKDGEVDEIADLFAGDSQVIQGLGAMLVDEAGDGFQSDDDFRLDDEIGAQAFFERSASSSSKLSW
jgi:hypothetical protein